MENESLIRVGAFVCIFTVMAMWEATRPARKAQLSAWVRWRGTFAMVLAGALITRLLLPGALVGVALWANNANWGVFNRLSLPAWIEISVCMLLLDLVIYWQHRLFHTVPLLWRFHQMHHADSHMDTTTGLRFHPIEIALSLLIKAAVVIFLGVPALAVVIFEVALNGFAMFNHANIKLPSAVDNAISKLFITQRVHRIHHSQRIADSNSNFGFSVSWWDKLFNSYQHETSLSDDDINIGQAEIPASKQNASVIGLLLMPFRRHRR